MNNKKDSNTSSSLAESLLRKNTNKKKPFCPFSVKGAPKIDYKNPKLLESYTTTGGRILPSRISGVSTHMQRKLKKAIKFARILALMPFVSNSSK